MWAGDTRLHIETHSQPQRNPCYADFVGGLICIQPELSALGEFSCPR